MLTLAAQALLLGFTDTNRLRLRGEAKGLQ